MAKNVAMTASHKIRRKVIDIHLTNKELPFYVHCLRSVLQACHQLAACPTLADMTKGESKQRGHIAA